MIADSIKYDMGHSIFLSWEMAPAVYDENLIIQRKQALSANKNGAAKACPASSTFFQVLSGHSLG
jgi:hypothetical protein